LGSSISQRQALLEPQGQSPELAINFMVAFIDCVETCGKLERLQFHITSASFCGIEVEGDLQIRTPRPKQRTHLEIQNPGKIHEFSTSNT